MIEDKDLLERIIAGDKKGFETIVSLYSSKIFNISLNFLQNKEDAEDITQEIFIKIFQSIHQFKGESKLSTWIYRIAITKSLDFLRKKNRKKRFALIQSLFVGEGVGSIHDETNFYHPGVELENKERAAILFSAINQLPKNQKIAFLLHKTEDLSYDEVAKVMEISLSSVESLLFRAKQNLRKLLGEYYKKNEK